MRRLLAALFAISLVAGACSEGDPSETTVLQVAVAVPATSTSTSTSVTTTSASTTTFLGPSVTYDPTTPRFSGEVIIAADQVPSTLNPYAPGGNDFITAIVGQVHLAGAYDTDPDTLELIPEVVTEVPTVGNGGVVVNADDSMDVTWHVREEARWSDAEPITGTDMAFTLEYRTATMECSGYQSGAEPLEGVEVIAIGDKNITVRFATISLQHELLFRWLVPHHAVAGSDFCDDWNTAAWPSSGPFVLEEWVRDGSDRHIRFVRNENYWKTDAGGNQLPYLDAVQFEFIPEADQLLAAFSDRRVDVINPPPFWPEIPVERWAAAGADIQLLPGPVWEHFNFQFGPNNRNPESLNAYLEFRQAIAHGLDRRALMDDAGYDWLDVSDGFLDRFTVAATARPWSQYAYDPDLARELLAIACDKAQRDCAADPPQIVYSSTSNAEFRPAIADQLADQLAAIGITVTLELEDSQLFFSDTLDNGTWDMGNWAWVGAQGSLALVDFFGRFAPDEPPPDGENVYNWGTPGSSVADDEAVAQFRVLLDRLRSSADADEIRALARQAEQILADQAVIIPLNARGTVGAVWADEIQGYNMNPTEAGHTWNIEHWYRVGD